MGLFTMKSCICPELRKELERKRKEKEERRKQAEIDYRNSLPNELLVEYCQEMLSLTSDDKKFERMVHEKAILYIDERLERLGTAWYVIRTLKMKRKIDIILAERSPVVEVVREEPVEEQKEVIKEALPKIALIGGIGDLNRVYREDAKKLGFDLIQMEITWRDVKVQAYFICTSVNSHPLMERARETAAKRKVPCIYVKTPSKSALFMAISEWRNTK